MGGNIIRHCTKIMSLSTAAAAAAIPAAATATIPATATTIPAVIPAAPAASNSAAAGMAAEATVPLPITLQDVLTNTDYHVDRERWFDLLQDDGVKMTPEELSKFSTLQKGKQKNKHYNIAKNGYFYPKIYELAGLVLGKMKQHPVSFPRLNMQPKTCQNVLWGTFSNHVSSA